MGWGPVRMPVLHKPLGETLIILGINTCQSEPDHRRESPRVIPGYGPGACQLIIATLYHEDENLSICPYSPPAFKKKAFLPKLV